MSPLKRNLLVAALLGGFFATLALGLSKDPREVPSPLIGKPAPEFSLPVLGAPERTVTADSLKGRVWVLNVWASWCTACRQEHPVLVELSRRKAVPLFGLDYKDEPDEGRAWLARQGDPYEASFVDRDGRTGIDWGVYGVPETFVIDKAGTIRWKHIGPLTAEVVETKLIPLVKELSR